VNAVEKEKHQSGRGLHDGFDWLVRATEADSNFNKMRELMRLYTLSGRHDKAQEMTMLTRMEQCIGETPPVEVKIEKDDSPAPGGPLCVVDVDLDLTTDDPSTLTKTEATVAPTVVSHQEVAANFVNLLAATDDSSIESSNPVLTTPNRLSGAGHNPRKVTPCSGGVVVVVVVMPSSLHGHDAMAFLQFLSTIILPALSAVMADMTMAEEVMASFKRGG
jgi:hypothetical protein